MYILTLENKDNHSVNTDFIVSSFNQKEVLHQSLKQADDSIKLSVPFSADIWNFINANKLIKAKITKDGASYFTGYVRPDFDYSKIQRFQPIQLELVNATYITSFYEIESAVSYKDTTLGAIVYNLLERAEIMGQDTSFLDEPIIFDIIEEGTTVKDALSQILFEYGYFWDFDKNGEFTVQKIYNKNVTSSVILDGTNILEKVQVSKKEQEFDRVELEYDHYEKFDNILIFQDNTGGSSVVRKGCFIELGPGKYLGQIEGETSYDITYDSDKGEVIWVDNASLSIASNNRNKVQSTFINKNTKGNLSVYNSDLYKSSFILLLEVYGTAYVKTIESATIKVGQDGKNKSIKSKHIHSKAAAENFAKMYYDWGKSCDYVISLQSKLNLDVGTIVEVDTAGKIIGRVLEKNTKLDGKPYTYKIEAIKEYELPKITSSILRKSSPIGTAARGTGILKIDTAPEEYTTPVSGITPAFRISTDVVKLQSKVGEVYTGDILQYSYYQYQVILVADDYVYTAERTSIRGSAGATGATGATGAAGATGKTGATGAQGTKTFFSDYANRTWTNAQWNTYSTVGRTDYWYNSTTAGMRVGDTLVITATLSEKGNSKGQIFTEITSIPTSKNSDGYYEIHSKTVSSLIGEKGATGDTGQRGGRDLAIITAPAAYTTAVGGFTPSYIIALSTVKTQSGIDTVYVGDTLVYGVYRYPVGYVDASYVYTAARTSVKGDTGPVVNTNLQSGNKDGFDCIGKLSNGAFDDHIVEFSNGVFEISNSKTAENHLFMADTTNLVSAGKKYTISFEAKQNGNLGSAEVFYYGNNYQTTGYITSSFFDATTEWQKISYTFTIPDGKTLENQRIRFDNNGTTNDGTNAILYIRNVKLEEGGIATPFCYSVRDTIGDKGASSRTIAYRINYSDFANTNDGEMYVCGYDSSGNQADVAGYVIVNYAVHYIKGMLNSGVPMNGYVAAEIGGTSDSPKTPFYVIYDWWSNKYYKIENGQAIDGKTWNQLFTEVTNKSNYVVLGKVACSSGEGALMFKETTPCLLSSIIEDEVNFTYQGVVATTADLSTSIFPYKFSQDANGNWIKTALGDKTVRKWAFVLCMNAVTPNSSTADPVIKLFNGTWWSTVTSGDPAYYSSMQSMAAGDLPAVAGYYDTLGLAVPSICGTYIKTLTSNKAFINELFANDITVGNKISTPFTPTTSLRCYVEYSRDGANWTTDLSAVYDSSGAKPGSTRYRIRFGYQVPGLSTRIPLEESFTCSEQVTYVYYAFSTVDNPYEIPSSWTTISKTSFPNTANISSNYKWLFIKEKFPAEASPIIYALPCYTTSTRSDGFEIKSDGSAIFTGNTRFEGGIGIVCDAKDIVRNSSDGLATITYHFPIDFKIYDVIIFLEPNTSQGGSILLYKFTCVQYTNYGKPAMNVYKTYDNTSGFGNVIEASVEGDSVGYNSQQYPNGFTDYQHLWLQKVVIKQKTTSLPIASVKAVLIPYME